MLIFYINNFFNTVYMFFFGATLFSQLAFCPRKNNMTVKSLNWGKLRKSRLAIPTGTSRIGTFTQSKHSPKVPDGLTAVCLTVFHRNVNTCLRVTEKYWPSNFKFFIILILMPVLVSKIVKSLNSV